VGGKVIVAAASAAVAPDVVAYTHVATDV
jgi:hypothetical protein